MAFTLKALNINIMQHGVELVKGRGYFYFASLDDRCISENAQLESIYVCHFNHCDAAWWVMQVDGILTRAGVKP